MLMKVFTKSFLALLLMTVMGVVSASAKTEKVHATFEAPSNTNTTWDAETKTFTWSTTYYNQLRNIGLPSGDITKYKKLVVDCTIKSGDQFRILFYKGGANLTLYAKDGVNEFIIKDELEAIAPNDYNEYLLACDEICLSGNNGAAPGEAVINDVYLETYDDEGEKVYATFEAPSNTNTTWDAETKTFTWSTTYYNQLRNIGLPSGDISGYKKLVVDCSIKSGERFRILFYKGGANLTLYAVDGLNEFIIKLQMTTTSTCLLVTKSVSQATMVQPLARLSSTAYIWRPIQRTSLLKFLRLSMKKTQVSQKATTSTSQRHSQTSSQELA